MLLVFRAHACWGNTVASASWRIGILHRRIRAAIRAYSWGHWWLLRASHRSAGPAAIRASVSLTRSTTETSELSQSPLSLRALAGEGGLLGPASSFQVSTSIDVGCGLASTIAEHHAEPAWSVLGSLEEASDVVGIARICVGAWILWSSYAPAQRARKEALVVRSVSPRVSCSFAVRSCAGGCPDGAFRFDDDQSCFRKGRFRCLNGVLQALFFSDQK